MATKDHVEHRNLLEQRSSALLEHPDFIGDFVEQLLEQNFAISRTAEDPVPLVLRRYLLPVFNIAESAQVVDFTRFCVVRRAVFTGKWGRNSPPRTR